MSKRTNQIALFLVFLLVLTPFAFASELQIKKVSDLQPGDVIVDQNGKEIPVEKVQATNYNFMTNLLQILSGKISKTSITGNIVAPITGNAIPSRESIAPDIPSRKLIAQDIPSRKLIAQDIPQDSSSGNAIPSRKLIAQDIPQDSASAPIVDTSHIISNDVIDSTGAAVPPTSTLTPSSMSNTFSGAASQTLTGTVQAGTYSSGSILTAGGSTISVPAGGSMQVLAPAKDGAAWTAKITDAKGVSSTQELGTATPTTSGLTSITTKEGTSTTSKFLGIGGGGYADAIVSGLQWAVIAYFAAQMLGPMLGLDKKQTDSLSLALASGAFVGEGAYVLTQQGGAYAGALGANSAMWSGVIGIGVAAAIFILTYKDTKTETVTFACEPWQAPTSKNGGTICEQCNDATLPCSEYRCKSLGQACELVNSGTTDEKCVYVNPKDVTPPVITPNPADLPSTKYKYTNVKLSPPGPGFTIKNSNVSNGCVPAFTPLTFGITTDEPSQCKIDFNHTENLDSMAYWMGGSNLYLYNHTEKFSLPGPANLKGENLTVINGGNWTFFLRCRDKNGNENAADYALRFCVDPTPDTTAPIIAATSIENGGCVAAGTQNASVNFYLNEPSTCRWSKTDQTYDSMLGTMSCSNSISQMNAQQLYSCNTKLDSISRDGTNYFIRCKDNAGNKMATSYEFKLKGSAPLLIKTIQPNETVFGGVNPAPVELFVQTNYGCEANKAICAYSTTGTLGEFISFADTNNADGVSTQKLFFGAGAQTVYVRCVDAGGNVANATANFNVEIDLNAPVVARAYQEDSLLKIITVRDSECSYTNDDCSFLFEEGTPMPTANTTVHVTDWVKDKTYYIKCRDEFQNEETADCSAVIKPIDNFL